MTDIKSYRDLKVWQKSMQLVTDVYRVPQSFPKEELYGLTSQIRRASVSIPANISEGSARSSTKSYIQFLNISKGSLSELETLLFIANNLAYLSLDELNYLLKQLEEIGKMVNGLIKSLKEALLSTES